jgi:hypothetical protein
MADFGLRHTMAITVTWGFGRRYARGGVGLRSASRIRRCGTASQTRPQHRPTAWPVSTLLASTQPGARRGADGARAPHQVGNGVQTLWEAHGISDAAVTAARRSTRTMSTGCWTSMTWIESRAGGFSSNKPHAAKLDQCEAITAAARSLVTIPC